MFGNILFHHEEEVECMEQEDLRMEQENSVLLRGLMVDPPEFSHENHGKRFDRFVLSVRRLSGAFDHLNILAEHSLLDGLDPREGPMVQVEGQIRSYHNHSGQGQKLLISVYADSISSGAQEPDNRVSLSGVVCREPVYRHTPLGREICDIMLAVERRYRRRDYIPCVLWGSVARMGAELERGDGLMVQGRLQSRNYTKLLDGCPEERTAFEVSAITACRTPTIS